MQTQSSTTQPINSTINPIAPIDSTAIVQHGESPTAIILAIAILIAILFNSLTRLVRIVAVLILRQHQRKY